MTAPDPRLGEIEGRLSKAVDLGPWSAKHPPGGDSWIAIEKPNGFTNVTGVVARRIDPEDAEFIANAPADIAYLLAELRKAQDALGRVEGLAAMWTSRGEHDMAYSKTVMVENARHVRAAVADATGGGE